MMGRCRICGRPMEGVQLVSEPGLLAAQDVVLLTCDQDNFAMLLRDDGSPVVSEEEKLTGPKPPGLAILSIPEAQEDILNVLSLPLPLPPSGSLEVPATVQRFIDELRLAVERRRRPGHKCPDIDEELPDGRKVDERGACLSYAPPPGFGERCEACGHPEECHKEA